MLLRSVRCAACGAPSDHLEGGYHLVCAHCGAIVEMASGMLFGEGRAESIRDAMRAQVRPTLAEARSTEVAMAMASAQAAGDRRTWRAAMREYLLLMPSLRPEMVPRDIETPAQLADYVERGVVAGEIATFDPTIAAAARRLDPALVYSSPDPVAGGHEYLERARRYFRAMVEHPDYPAAFAQKTNVDAMAKDNLRAMVAGVASLMGPERVRRVFVEVLGAKEAEDATASCGTCGAPVEKGITECPWCRAQLSDVSDAWLSSLVSGFEAVKATNQDDAQLAIMALAHPISGHHLGGDLPSADDIMRFLRAAVPYLSAPHLATAASTLSHAYPAELLGEVAARVHESWTPGPRPVREEPEVARYESVAAAKGSPWVRQQLALYAQSRIEDAFSLVSMALTPFHMGSAVSPEEMVAFVRVADPGRSKGELVEATDQLGQAFASKPAIERALRAMRVLLTG